MNVDQEAKEISVGHHVAECVNITEGKAAKSGSSCKVFKFMVITGSDEACFISDRFYMGEWGIKFMARMMKAAGKGGTAFNNFNEHGTAEYYFNKLAGMRVGIDVDEDSYTDKQTGVTTISPKIKKYAPLTKNEKADVSDISRMATEEYIAPVEKQESSGSGEDASYGSTVDADDCPY